MKRSTMLKKANKILASVMTASMLVSTVVPGTMVYASEISAPDVETEDGFTDGTEEMQENPVAAESLEGETPEVDDGSTVVEAGTRGFIDSVIVKEVDTYESLKNAIEDSTVTEIKLTGDIAMPQEGSEFKITKSLTIDLAGHTITGNGKNGIFCADLDDNTNTFKLKSTAEQKGKLTNGKGYLTMNEQETGYTFGGAI